MSTNKKIWIVTTVCAYMVVMTLSVFGQPCPLADNPILGPNEVCPGSQAQYTVTNDNSGTSTYQWTLGAGGQIIGPTTGPTITVQWQDVNGGPFTIDYVETNISTKCTYPNQVLINVADDIARRPFNCFSELSIPFDENCEKLILPEHLLTYGAPDCANSFEVRLFVDDDIPVANPVGIQYLGQVITAHVIHPPTGRTCVSRILFKDGTAPELFCENDTTICSDPAAWNPFDTSFKEPYAIDNCDEQVEVMPEGYEWVQLFNDPLFDALIIRTWSAEDKFHNRNTCQDTIFLRRVVFNMIACPPDTVISCERQYLPTTDSLYFSPDDPLTSGVPTFMGYPLWTERSYCDFTIKYEDLYSYKCPGTYTIHRYWYLSQVTPSIIFEDTCHQVIEVVDTVGPVAVFDTAKVKMEIHDDVYGLRDDTAYYTIRYPTLDYECLAYGYFPNPIIIEECGNIDSVTVDLIWENGHINYLYGSPEADHLRFENLSKGKHIVTLKLRDQCHNTTYDTLIVIAEDKEPPYLVVDKEPVVTLNNSGKVTWIDVSVFDEGTWDNCGIELMLARRVDWWNNGVDLCDSINYRCGYEHDSIFCAILEENKQVNELEAHYVDVMRWLKEDGGSCGDLMYKAWRYDLCKKATFECLPYKQDKYDHFKELFNNIPACSSDFEMNAHHPGNVNQWDQIGGGWSKEIPFFCTDACAGEKVTIEIIALDAYCNYSKIWVDVLVEDKSLPEVEFYLPDLEISCWSYNTYYRDSVDKGNFNVFGRYQPFYLDPYAENEDRKTVIYDRICDDYTSEEDYYTLTTDTILNGLVYENCDLLIKETQKLHFERCGEGWIERHFVFKAGCNATKADSTKAIQRIYIYNDCPLQEHEIIWPVKDTTVYACDYYEVETQEPRLKHYDECREIGIHHKDEIVDILYNADSTCLKVIRTWAVIDWCRQTAPYHEDWIGDQNYHYYEYEQIIYMKNTEGPVFTHCEFDTLCIGNDCVADLVRVVNVSDDCTPEEEISVSWVLYEATEFGYLPVDQGETKQVNVPDLELGSYKLVFKAEDGCHNVSHCSNTFEVVDCIKPTAVCLSSTTVKLLPIDLNLDGQIDTAVGEIWARELNVSSYDNCFLDVDFRIRIQGTGSLDKNGRLLPPDSTQQSLAFGCDDVGIQNVEMWVVDHYGNADYCVVSVKIDAPAEGCHGVLGKVKGTVSSLRGAGIPDAYILLNNALETRLVLTNKLGQYDFSPYQMDGTNYQIWPEKYDDPIQGITTLDVLRISKHLLLKEPFKDPFELIAGDANGDGDVSVRDIITLRKLILAKVDTLPIDSPWRFFNKDMKPESDISIGMDYKPYLNFTGIKIGDVNGDVTKSASASGRAGEGSHIWTYEERNFYRGQELEVSLSSNESGWIEGFQMEISVDPTQLKLIDLLPKILGLTTADWNIRNSVLYISWISDDPVYVDEGTDLFTIRLEAEGEGRMSGAMAATKHRILPQLYARDSSFTISIVPYESTPSTFVLSQNVPNPFTNYTNVRIEFSEDMEAMIKISDLSGRIYYRDKRRFEKGYYDQLIKRDQLGSTGIYLYEVATEKEHRILKMLLTQ